MRFWLLWCAHVCDRQETLSGFLQLTACCETTCQQLSKTVRCMFCCLWSLAAETEEKTQQICPAVDLRWTRVMLLSSLFWSVREQESELWSVEEGGVWYLYALLGSLCAVHHHGESESGDKTRYEMLQTQTQHCHTWGRADTIHINTTYKTLPLFKVYDKKPRIADTPQVWICDSEFRYCI